MSLTPEEWATPRLNRRCISLGKHSTGHAQELGKRGRFAKVSKYRAVIKNVVITINMVCDVSSCELVSRM